jgi:uncharacterized protein
VPGIVVGIILARMFAPADSGNASPSPPPARRVARWGALAHEILLGKSVVLLIGGLAIGWYAGPDGIDPMRGLFFDLFKGVLALFLLEMGLVAASRIGELRRAGIFLVAFGIVVPVCFAVIGLTIGKTIGLSLGGTTLLATLAASASYIAAPAAIRIAIPEANPALSIGAALGITFPFNLTIGIPLYFQMAQRLY